MFKDVKAFTSFSVNDIAAARKFYVQTLGLDVADRMEGLELNVGDGHKVFIYAKPDHIPAMFTVLNFPVDNVETAVSALSDRGIRFEQYDKPGLKTDARGICHGKPNIAWFKDPAGNIISVLDNKS